MKKIHVVFCWLAALAILVAGCAPAATPAPAETEAVAEGQQPAASPAEVIKIGALYPLTGPDAGWAGDPYIKSHQMAIDEINANGGIKCMGGAKLELVKGDTQGKAESANLEMERLITKEGVTAVMGDVISGTTIPDSEIAEKYEVPYIVPNSLDGRLISRGMKYVFMTVSTMQDWGKQDVIWAKDNGAKTAVITTPNFSFGEEVQEIWKNAIEEVGGIELLDNIRYDGNAQDFTDTILKIKMSDPDVLFLLGNNQATVLVKQLKEQGYWPKMGIITLGSGFATSFFLNEVTPELAEGIIFTMDFAPVSKLPVPQELKDDFKEYTGQDLGGTYNTTYASTFLLADALEKSCSTDPKKLAETLRTTKFEDGKWKFQWPSASFAENGLLNEAPTVIGQWQNGEMVAIWPEEFAAAEPIWPVPGWDQR